MKVILYERSGGNLSIIHPAPKSRQKDEDEQAWIERIAKRSIPPNTPHVVIEKDELPPSRRWRDAWRLQSDNTVKVDLNAAKTIRMQELLRERDRILANLRKQIEDAEDEGDDTRVAELRAQRKALKRAEAEIVSGLSDLPSLESVGRFTLAVLQEG